MQALDDLLYQHGWISAGLETGPHRHQRGRGIPADQSRQELVEAAGRHPSRELVESILCELSLAIGHQLVEQRLGISHPPPGIAGDLAKQLLAGLALLSLADLGETIDRILFRDRLEIKPLTTRENRIGNLVRFGGGEDELDVRRRLLEGLQERVEGLTGQHMNLVNEVDLVISTRSRPVDPLDNRPDIIDAAMGGAIELDNIDVLAGMNRLADAAFVARACPLLLWPVTVVGRRTVDRLGKDSRHRGLADPPGTGEEIGVSHSTLEDPAAESPGDGFLANHLFEFPRPVPASDDFVFHPRPQLQARRGRRRDSLDAQV